MKKCEHFVISIKRDFPKIAKTSTQQEKEVFFTIAKISSRTIQKLTDSQE